MSFGLSPDRQKTFMVGADVAVAWIDKETGKGYAEDYYLDAKSQCSGNRGSCPDARFAVSVQGVQPRYPRLISVFFLFKRIKLIRFEF